MANILPFKGTLYNQQKINGLSKVVAPPYDVISPLEQDELYNADPYNIIRILFGKDLHGDNEKENKYTRASEFLKRWHEENILKRDEHNSIYIYLQEFSINGQVKSRLGFIALLKLEDFDTGTSSVYPHENTLLAPKEDRTRLITSIEANLGPIFAVFADEDKSIDKILLRETESRPVIDIQDHHGIRNKLWHVFDNDTITAIVRLIKDKKLFIADGHHRYEVALAFSKAKKDPRYEYILTYFTDIYADGIVVLPVHRIIAGVKKEVLGNLEQELKKNFVTEHISSKEDINVFLSAGSSSEKRFVVYDGSKYIGLRLEAKGELDVTVLHDLIIEPLRRKVELGGGKISVDFTKDLDYAVSEVESGRFSVSIMLNSTKITEIRDMAFSGRRMPQKSTYFYPKVLTGLVINVF